jgi:hypothetical protein
MKNVMKRLSLAFFLSIVGVLGAFVLTPVRSLQSFLDIMLAPGFAPLRLLGIQGPFHNIQPILLGFVFNVTFYTFVIAVRLRLGRSIMMNREKAPSRGPDQTKK